MEKKIIWKREADGSRVYIYDVIWTREEKDSEEYAKFYDDFYRDGNTDITNSWVTKEAPHRHYFHMVDPSPWPACTSMAALCVAIGAARFFHGYHVGLTILSFGLISLIFFMSLWWRDVVEEATFDGYHTKDVQFNLRFGFILFIASEVMFFFSFFWAYFHSSLAPVSEIGAFWPPFGITPFDPWGIPLLNTFILLLSGATITAAHHYLLDQSLVKVMYYLFSTILLGIIFTGVQIMEYLNSTFTMSDGAYGSTFFLITGFHGFHVLVGTLFLIVCFFRLINRHFTSDHHVGLECAIWYWHFVDVVWLFVFFSIYWWGGLTSLVFLKFNGKNSPHGKYLFIRNNIVYNI